MIPFTGTYGVVCSALHKETGTTRAIKELKKSKKNKAKNDLLLKVRANAKRLGAASVDVCSS